jgi:hypothetical protein
MVTGYFCAAVITHFILYLIKAGLLPVRFQMAPEGRRTAVLDGLHHAALLGAEGMGAPVRLPIFPEDLRELQPPRPRLGVRGLAHGSGAGLWGQGQEIERRGRVLQVPLCQMEVAHRGRDVPVSQETLDAVEIDSRFQQMRRKGMP